MTKYGWVKNDKNSNSETGEEEWDLLPIKTCYECDQEVNYLFDDGRGHCCTRMTPEEVRGDIIDE